MHDVPDAALPPSIALSVLVRASRRVRVMFVLAALLHAGLAAVIFCTGDNIAWPWVLALASALASGLCMAAACQPLTPRRIDISKAGALTLTVQQNLPDTGCAVRLLPGSVLWRRLLVLRLGGIDGAPLPVHTVLVLPDSTDRAAFRALAVAMRAIAGRSHAGDMQKID